MQNSFEKLSEIIDNLEFISEQNHSLPQIEKDILLEKLRKIYVNIQSKKKEQIGNELIENKTAYSSNLEEKNSQRTMEKPNFAVAQGMKEDVDLFFDTDHESYNQPMSEEDQEAILQQEIEAESRRKAEAEARRKAEEEARRKAEEEARRKAEEEARRKAEEEARRKAEEEARRKAEEEARRKAEEEARRKAEEEARRKAEEEARRKAEEETRRKAEEEARRKAEEEARRKAAEEARRKAEEEARRKAEEEARRKAEEEARRKAEKEAQGKSQKTSNSDEDDLLQFMPQTSAQKKPEHIAEQPKRSLNDLFNEQKEDRSLSAQFQRAKVHDLTKAISINDKFTFIKELFNNRGEEFSTAIQALNQCENIEKAFDCLENYKKKYFWDTTSTAYLALCDLLRRKYM